MCRVFGMERTENLVNLHPEINRIKINFVQHIGLNWNWTVCIDNLSSISLFEDKRFLKSIVNWNINFVIATYIKCGIRLRHSYLHSTPKRCKGKKLAVEIFIVKKSVYCRNWWRDLLDDVHTWRILFSGTCRHLDSSINYTK